MPCSFIDMSTPVRRLPILRKTVAAVAIACACHQPAAAQSFFESFDGEGSSLQNTLFSDVFSLGGATFQRESLTAVPGAPNTDPALPINQAGDKELRYFEKDAPAYYHSVILTAPLSENTFLNGSIDGYVGFGLGSGFGSRQAGLILRATTPDDYWLAYLGANMSLTGGASLRISLVSGGIVGWSEGVTFADLDFTRHAYRLHFEASGAMLTTSLYEQGVQAGLLTERLIADISSVDHSPLPGRAGLYAFVRGDNSVLFDDITLTIPEPGIPALLLLAIALSTCVRRSRVA
jgi:hypothetical protein